MDQVVVFLEEILNYFLRFAILLFEYVGVIVIVISGIRGIYNYARKNPLTKLYLAQGLAMGLEFKLGSEILRTVVIRDISEIVIVGAIIALRAILTFLIHWEIKNEKEEAGENSAEPSRMLFRRKRTSEEEKLNHENTGK